MEEIPSSGTDATDYVELICHLGAYSSVMTLVNGYTPDQIDRLSHAVRAMYPAESTLIHASSLGLGYSIEQRLAEYFQINPAQFGANTRSLMMERASQTGSTDPLLVVIERGDLMTINQLEEASELALMAPQQISFCILGMNDFDRSLADQKGSAHIYRIRLQPPANWQPAQSARPDLEGVSPSDNNNPGFDEQTDSDLRDEQTGFIASMRSKLEDLIPAHESQNPSGSESDRRFPKMHLVALGLVLLILLISLMDMFLEESKPEPPATTPVEVRSLDIAAPPVLSSDSAFKEVTPVEKKADEPPSRVITNPAKTSKHVDQYHLVETSPRPTVESQSRKTEETQISEQPKSARSAVKQPVQSSNLPAGEGYLVQLMAAENKSGADDFIARWAANAPTPLYRLKTKRNDQVWYIVYMAPYGSRQTALADISRLPIELRRQKPWIRPLSAVRKIV
ncbi:MAG: SPOR domain-containing protein, partial [Ketobacter sp.]